MRIHLGHGRVARTSLRPEKRLTCISASQKRKYERAAAIDFRAVSTALHRHAAAIDAVHPSICHFVGNRILGEACALRWLLANSRAGHRRLSASIATVDRLWKLDRTRLSNTRADGLTGKLCSAAKIASFDAGAQCARMHFQQGKGYWARQVFAEKNKYAGRTVALNAARHVIMVLPIRSNVEKNLKVISKSEKFVTIYRD